MKNKAMKSEAKNANNAPQKINLKPYGNPAKRPGQVPAAVVATQEAAEPISSPQHFEKPTTVEELEQTVQALQATVQDLQGRIEALEGV